MRKPEPREPNQGHLVRSAGSLRVPTRTGRQKSLWSKLNSSLYTAELSSRALYSVVVGLSDL